MNIYISIPSGSTGSFPGLILFQEAFGDNRHIRSLADGFAEQGISGNCTGVIPPDIQILI